MRMRRSRRMILASSRARIPTLRRARMLKAWAIAKYGSAGEDRGDQDGLRAVINANIGWLMDDQIKTARYGRTEYIIDHQAALGMPEGMVHFYRAEMLLQRRHPGDEDAAKSEYELATQSPSVPVAAYRNYGYLLVKAGDRASAQAQFKRYLEN